jgi:hypothetical protein
MELMIYSPQDYKELFNLRHAQMRNVIERIFGAAKKRWLVLEQGTRLSTKAQAVVTIAFMVIINFIRVYDPDDLPIAWNPETEHVHAAEAFANAGDAPELEGLPDEGELGGVSISAAERRFAEERRDRIAHAMWLQYVEYTQE